MILGTRPRVKGYGVSRAQRERTELLTMKVINLKKAEKPSA